MTRLNKSSVFFQSRTRCISCSWSISNDSILVTDNSPFNCLRSIATMQKLVSVQSQAADGDFHRPQEFYGCRDGLVLWGASTGMFRLVRECKPPISRAALTLLWQWASNVIYNTGTCDQIISSDLPVYKTSFWLKEIMWKFVFCCVWAGIAYVSGMYSFICSTYLY